MKKIPTMFVRSADRRTVTDQVAPGCEWVLAGEGRATLKWDGTCVMLATGLDGRVFDGPVWWARREVKPGGTPPADWVEVDHDDTTGKRFGWEPAEQSGFAKYLAEALDGEEETLGSFVAGTYELIGPKINGNPERQSAHRLVRHGAHDLDDDLPGRSYKELADWFAEHDTVEGIVFWHDDGRMAKIKRRDFAASLTKAAQ